MRITMSNSIGNMPIDHISNWYNKKQDDERRQERYVHLWNPNLYDMDVDHLCHLSLSKGAHDLRTMFSDIKYVCMGSTPKRMERFAHMVREDLDIILPTGATLCDLAAHSFRYSLYKVGPVLSVSHGTGIPSLSIVLHEVLKLLHYARCSNVTFIKVGACGGIDIRTGSMIVTDEVVDGMLRPYLKLDILGKSVQRAAVLDKELVNELKSVADETISECKTFIGKTMCTFDYYEGQGRLNGAFCDYTQNEKLAYLKSIHSKGIKSIEMESLAFAAMCHHAGIKCAVVSVVLVDRLLDDQMLISREVADIYKDRPLRLVSKFLKSRYGESNIHILKKLS